MSDNTKPRIQFEENQTEGEHTTAFRYDNTELKKGPFAVATHLKNLYDVDVITVPPVDQDVLKYNEAIEKWVPGQVESGGCILLSGEIFLHVIYKVEGNETPNTNTYTYSHGNYYDGEDHTGEEISPIGTYENPFAEIADCIQWIQNNCRVISDDAKINIMVYSEEGEHNLIPLLLSWNKNVSEFKERFYIQWRPTVISYPYAHRIFIYGVSAETGPIPSNGIENVQRWYNNSIFTYPLRIRYMANISCSGTCPGCGEYQYATTQFQPFFSVKGGLTLGGLYNFKFEEPDVNISCAGDPGSEYGN